MAESRKFFFRSNHSCLAYGFTILELMLVLSILSILASIALPYFQQIINRFKVRIVAASLEESIYLARTEAIRRGGNIVLRKLSARPGCSGSVVNGRWECGWQIFHDQNGNGQLNTGEDLIYQVTEIRTNIVVVRSPSANMIRFDQWGNVTGLGIFNFSIRPEDDFLNRPENYDVASLLCISAGGRLREIKNKKPPCE